MAKLSGCELTPSASLSTLSASLHGSSEFILRPDHQSWHRSKLGLKSRNEKGKNEKYYETFAKRFFQRKLLYRRLPIIDWLPRYSAEDAIGDLIAGITVALAVIPLALAFVGIAKLPIEAGLYSSFACNFVYTIFGTCKDNIVGSTAIASLLTFQATQGSIEKAVLFTFLSGLIEIILLGLCRFSFVIDFVSGPVSAGFMSAVALIIFTSQIKDILVIKSTGSSFLQNWTSMIADIRNYRMTDSVLGLSSVLVLLVLRYIGNLRVKHFINEPLTKIVNKIFWFCGVSRNAMLVFVCAGIVASLESFGSSYFVLVGPIPSGFPSLQLPKFSIDAVAGNDTIGIASIKTQSFVDMVQDFGANLIVIPLIALLESIAVCKTFSNGRTVDTTQEVMTIGLGNVVNSFFGGYRVNGGLARAAINTASGGRTPMVNIYVSGIVILALLYFAKYFYYIPRAVLAAIIISVVIFQLQYQVIVPMWKSKKSDLLPYVVAFIACLVLPLTLGIALAIGINLLFILYHSARPKIAVEPLETPSGIKFLKLTPDRSLIFPSADFVRNSVQKSGIKYSMPVVIDCTYVYGADFTAAKVITSMLEDFDERRQKIIFYNLKPSVVRVFEGVNMKILLCYDLEALEKALGATDVNHVSVMIPNELTKL